MAAFQSGRRRGRRRRRRRRRRMRDGLSFLPSVSLCSISFLAVLL
jgi:hypothetical protein